MLVPRGQSGYDGSMPTPPRADQIAQILRDGPKASASELLPLLYEELRRLARAQVDRRARDFTIRATELVHEAWMHVVGEEDPGWDGRGHFFGAAARAMRNILVDQARRRNASKRDAARRAPLDDDIPQLDPELSNTDVIALNEAMDALEEHHARPAKVVELRFFSGLDIAEIAGVLQVSTPTVERDWRFARAWLQERLSSELPDD